MENDTMPMTQDDYKATENYLKSEYFFVRTQTIWIISAVLAAFGVGTIATAYAAAKAAIASEAAKLATAEIIKLKDTAETEVKLIQVKRTEAEKTVAGLARKLSEIKDKVASLEEKLNDRKMSIIGEYHFVQDSKLRDRNPYGSIGREEDGSLYVAFNNESKGFGKGNSHRSTATIMKDGTLVVPHYLHPGMAVTEAGAVVPAFGTPVGRNIFWNFGQQWAR